MKKILKKVFGFLALALILGGTIVFLFQYWRNQRAIEILLDNSVVKNSIDLLIKMAYSILAVIVGLILSSIYFRLGSSIRKDEKAKKKEEELRLEQEAKVQEENNTQEETQEANE